MADSGGPGAARDERGHPGGHLRLALPALARRLLPEGPGRSGAELEYAAQPAAHHRDQRLVLLAAATGQLAAVARRRARGFRVRRQGRPVHHPHETAARPAVDAGAVLRLRPAAAGRAARPDPVAAPAELPVRPRAAGRLLRRPARTPRAPRPRWPGRTTAPSAAPATSRSGTSRERATPAGRSGTRSRSGTRASRRTTSSSCAAATASRSRSPTAPRAGRGSTRSPPTTSTCGCTAPTSSTSAATRRPTSTRWADRVRGWAEHPGVRQRARLLRQRREGPSAVRRDVARRAGSGWTSGSARADLHGRR